VIVTIVSKLVIITYFGDEINLLIYRDYNPFILTSPNSLENLEIKSYTFLGEAYFMYYPKVKKGSVFG